jgi:hypothetical protein
LPIDANRAHSEVETLCLGKVRDNRMNRASGIRPKAGLQFRLGQQTSSSRQGDHEPRAACERLVAEANARGGKDNISVIMARF